MDAQSVHPRRSYVDGRGGVEPVNGSGAAHPLVVLFRPFGAGPGLLGAWPLVVCDACSHGERRQVPLEPFEEGHMATASVAQSGSGGFILPKSKIWQVIGASSAGTVIEWYDFYIFGSLAAILAPKFYPAGNDALALIAYLSTFAVGFVVRPFGAIFFGRIGDLVGRKYAFLVTLVIMGGATASIGLLPTFGTIGYAAPIALLTIRILQGLALGGEYGGAAVYVAEHVPDKKRGFYTSFIQITATLGLFVSLGVVLICQTVMSKEDFSNWGWRLPFLLSIFLVGMSLFIRMRMKESPIFSHLKSQGKTSVAPLKDAFTHKENLKRMAVSLFGATAGQGVVWYTGQFYALFYMQKILSIETKKASIIVAVALLLGMPFFVFFGWLSDRVGRKRIMMTGCLLAAVSYIPIYKLMVAAAGNGVVGVATSKNPITGETLVKPTTLVNGVETAVTTVAANPNVVALVALIFIQVIFVTMVYGPIAAYLVEAFPAKVRYTSMSLPYHIGNGIFGGLLPVIGLSVAAATGSIYAGLYYPIGIALLTFVVGSLLLKETGHTKIWDDFDAEGGSDHYDETQRVLAVEAEAVRDRQPAGVPRQPGL
jgi:MFS family permease